jgi:trehalose 6-phosphate synthase/phosphatase
VSPEELTALYNLADVLVVSSVRDGMNLVSHEYIICQNKSCAHRDGPGVLILSEFAGSAQSLLSGAIRINPWNSEELASALHQALTLEPVERELRQFKLHRFVSTHTASFWAQSFLAELKDACQLASTRTGYPLERLPMKRTLADYGRSCCRLIIMEYDGTLTQVQSRSLPQLAAPGASLRALLAKLASDASNSIYIVSGSERNLLDRWFCDLDIGLVAEGGFFFRHAGQAWETLGLDTDSIDNWKGVVLPIMTYFVERTPGSYTHTKESSLTWHYRDTDLQFGSRQAVEMQVHLEDVLSSLPLDVVQGNRMVEVRHQGNSKGTVVERILQDTISRCQTDFVFCVGGDSCDNDMYSVLNQLQDPKHQGQDEPSTNSKPLPFGKNKQQSSLPHPSQSANVSPAVAGVKTAGSTGSHAKCDESAPELCMNARIITCHIGPGPSQASYYLDGPKDLQKLLRDFSDEQAR